jgi:hypothetical protein
MEATIKHGWLNLIPENEQEEKDINKWYIDTYDNYDQMFDFMVWIEEIMSSSEIPNTLNK